MKEEIIKSYNENEVNVTITRVMIGEKKNIERFHVRGSRKVGKSNVNEYSCRNTIQEAEKRAEQILVSLADKPTGMRWDEKRKKAVPIK